MATAADVAKNQWVALKTILQNALLISNGGYCHQIYEGRRTTIPEMAYPCVIMEPESENESKMTQNIQRKKMLKLKIHLIGAIECINYDQQIYGSPGVAAVPAVLDGDGNIVTPAVAATPAVVGIMDIARDIRNAIDAFPQLNYDGAGKRCNLFVLTSKGYNAEMYPFRFVDVVFDSEAQIEG